MSVSIYSFVFSALLFELANFTISKTAEIASAVLKSSSIACSNLSYISLSDAIFSASSAAMLPSFAFSDKCLRLATAVTILSSPFFADSIKSWLKLIGLR